MTVVMGAGLAGLSAGYSLSKSGVKTTVVEKDSGIGGLAKTVCHSGFRFDLGGHRFLTNNFKVERFVKGLIKDDTLTTQRKSSIYMFNRYFDYPLRPLNAIFGIGPLNTSGILYDYLKEKVRGVINRHELISLEDWVVNRFGRKMFDIYFKEYSEKVWGIDCSRISSEWVAERIRGLSLHEAMLNAFFSFSGRDIPTLADSFIYPRMGIGQISEVLAAHIRCRGSILSDTKVIGINHSDYKIMSVSVMDCKDIYDIGGKEFISSIPLPNLIRSLHPSAPDRVIDAASHLRFRDLIIVTLMLDRNKVSDQTWIYLPEKEIPIGRVHEPKNWSECMAPDGFTHLVSEYFCFRGDTIWRKSNAELIETTAKHLSSIGFITNGEVIDASVIRVPDAYPVLTVDYLKHYRTVIDYLANFENLHIIGRGGMFRYHNMDQVIETGMTVANRIILKHRGAAVPEIFNERDEAAVA